MRLSLLTLILGISFMCVSFGGFAEEIQMPPNVGPQILQVVGDGDAYLDPTRYPEFYSYRSDNDTCGEYLKQEFDESAVVDGVSMKGLSLAPLWVISRYNRERRARPILSEAPGYQEIPGLRKTYAIGEAYRKSANILITWTVRVEGYKYCLGGRDKCDNDAYVIWPSLCDRWHGTSNQRFPGGEVKTALFINGEQKGPTSVMTIPDGGVTSTYQPSDPTHTGSYLITADSFANGQLPESIEIEVKWYNDTPMKIKSPDKMRNLIITVVPIEKKTE